LVVNRPMEMNIANAMTSFASEGFLEYILVQAILWEVQHVGA